MRLNSAFKGLKNQNNLIKRSKICRISTLILLSQTCLHVSPLQFSTIRGWYQKFSASTIDGNTIGKIFFAIYQLYSHNCWIAGKRYNNLYKLLHVDMCVCGRLENYILVFDWPTYYCWAGLTLSYH